ncbi:MAG: flagellar assembly protein FliW [Peptococcaceae bacterium BICA1-8]|nr:MAG: flagellar assembly protein FliW [Peptococcaceae bacterium BICA1-8]
MLINTRDFGEIEVQEEKIIHFPYGIIAFEEMKRFFIIESGQEDLPFCWLQSVDEGDLAFVLLNPFLFKKDYELEIPDGVVKELEIEKEEEVAVFSVIVVPEDINKITANLLAPIIINTKSFKGKQIILNNNKKYTTKHYILEELKKVKGAVQDACAK